MNDDLTPPERLEALRVRMAKLRGACEENMEARTLTIGTVGMIEILDEMSYHLEELASARGKTEQLTAVKHEQK